MEYKLRTILNIEKKSTLKGFRMVFPLLPSVAIFGCIFGFTGGMFKYSLLLISLSSVIVFAGTSQFIVLILINQNEPFIAIALSGIIVNLRHILYGAALRNDISTKGVKRFILAYLLTDEAFLVTKLVKKNPLYDKDLLLDDVLFGSGILVWIIWNISTVIGYLSISVFEFNISISPDFIVAATFLGYFVNHWFDTPSERKFMLSIIILSFIFSFFLQKSYLLIIILILGIIIVMIGTYYNEIKKKDKSLKFYY